MRAHLVLTFLFALIPMSAVWFMHYRIGPYSWDDAAITMAFARTLGETGRFALTPVGPVVEGTSSLLLTFGLSGIYALADLSFDQKITAGRMLAGLCLTAIAILIYREFAQGLTRRGRAAVIALAFMLAPVHFVEIFNGTELLLFGLLLALYCRFFQQGHGAALALIPLILLCRFEGVFYLCFALGVVFALGRTMADRRQAFVHICLTLACFGAMTAVRMAVFGAPAPNTVLAKMHPAYQVTQFDAAYPAFAGLVEVLWYYAPILALALAAVILWPETRRRLDLWILFAFAVFALLIGRNWGYYGRMALGAGPVALLFVASVYRRGWMMGPVLAVWLGLFAVAGSYAFISTVRLWWTSDLITHRNEDRSNENPANPYAHSVFNIVPDSLRLNGEAALALSRKLGVEGPVTIVTPDVGGIALCCPSLRIIDTALLTNPVLTRSGYGGFDAQLRAESPHLVLSQGAWSKLSGLHDNAWFADNYLPVKFRNLVFWVRDDLIEIGREQDVFTELDAAKMNIDRIRYLFADVDKTPLLDRGSVLFVRDVVE